MPPAASSKAVEKKSWQSMELKKKYSVCVTCLKKGKFKDLNETHHHYGKQEVYSEMLSYCFSLQLAPRGNNKDRIYSICDKCITKLRHATEFRKQVDATQNKYKKLYSCFSLVHKSSAQELTGNRESTPKPDDGMVLEQGEMAEDAKTSPRTDCLAEEKSQILDLEAKVSIKKSRNQIKRCDEELVLTRCELCYESFRSMEELNRHMRIHDANIYPVHLFDTSSTRNMLDHEHFVQNIKQEAELICDDGDIILVVQADDASEQNSPEPEEYEDKGESTEPAGDAFQCAHCAFSTSSRRALHSHLAEHPARKTFLCEECGFASRQFYQLRLHQLVHSSRKPHACDRCAYASRYASDLALHKRTHSDSRPYTCEVCGKQYRSSVQLRAHQETHAKARYKCERCDFKTKSSHVIKKHAQNHDRSLTCKHCGEIFERRCDLTRHRVTVHDALIKRDRVAKQGGFQCDICNISFKSEWHLTKHKVSHTNERPFGCDQCSLKFKRKTDVYKHRLIHSSVKPFACHLCSFASVRAADLRIHFRKHSDLRPFPCPSCPMRFKKRDTLTRHLVTHSEAKPYVCRACGFRCKTGEALKRHERTHAGPRLACRLCEYSCLEGRQLLKHALRQHADKPAGPGAGAEDEPAGSRTEVASDPADFRARTDDGPVDSAVEVDGKTVVVQWLWGEE